MSRFERKIPPPLLWVATATLVWIIALSDLDGRPLDSPTADLAGIVLAVIGVGLGVVGIMQFSKSGTTVDPHHPDRTVALVTSGVYGITRNPMYLGMVVILIGWAVRLGTVIGLVVGPLLLATVLTYLQIRPEERILSDRFGAEYESYRSKTRRWI